MPCQFRGIPWAYARPGDEYGSNSGIVLQAVAQDDDPGNGKDRRMNDKEHIKQLQKLLADQKAETARVTAERDELQAALDQIAAMATRP